jgi:nitrate/nitrite transporter NarK
VKSLSGLPNLLVTLISALPYCAGFIAMQFVGWRSDRTGERRFHTALPMLVGGAGLLLSAVTQDNTVLAVAMLCTAAAGLYSYLPSFWALPTTFLTGAAAAASIGLINSIGNLGGFAGPYVVGYVNSKTNSFFGGMLYLSLSAVVAAILIFALRQPKRSIAAQPAEEVAD